MAFYLKEEQPCEILSNYGFKKCFDLGIGEYWEYCIENDGEMFSNGLIHLIAIDRVFYFHTTTTSFREIDKTRITLQKKFKELMKDEIVTTKKPQRKEKKSTRKGRKNA